MSDWATTDGTSFTLNFGAIRAKLGVDLAMERSVAHRSHICAARLVGIDSVTFHLPDSMVEDSADPLAFIKGEVMRARQHLRVKQMTAFLDPSEPMFAPSDESEAEEMEMLATRLMDAIARSPFGKVPAK